MYVLMVRTRSALPIYGISSPLICFLNSFSVSQPRVWFCKKKNCYFYSKYDNSAKHKKRSLSNGRGSWVWAWVKVVGVGNAWWVTRRVCLMVVGRGSWVVGRGSWVVGRGCGCG